MLIVSALYGARSQEFHSSRHMCCDDVTIKVIWFDFDFGVKFDPEKFLTGWDCLLTKGTFTSTEIKPQCKLKEKNNYNPEASWEIHLLIYDTLRWFSFPSVWTHHGRSCCGSVCFRPAESCWLILQHSQEDLCSLSSSSN